MEQDARQPELEKLTAGVKKCRPEARERRLRRERREEWQEVGRKAALQPLMQFFKRSVSLQYVHRRALPSDDRTVVGYVGPGASYSWTRAALTCAVAYCCPACDGHVLREERG